MSRIVTATLVLTIITLLSVTIPAPGHANPLGISWANKAPIPDATGQAGVTTGPDGKIYVMGGYSVAFAATTTARSYNPATNTWTSLHLMLNATRGAVAVTDQNGLIYVIGGYDSTDLATNQAYNITTDTWSPKASLPTGVWQAGGAAGNDGRIYIFGGENGGTLTQIYNPKTDSWTSGTAVPYPVFHWRAVKSPSGFIYTIGGSNAGGSVLEYDTIQNSWRTMSPMPHPRLDFGATLGPDGLIYTFGGSLTSAGGNDQPPYLNTVDAFDPSANQWFTLSSSLPTPRRELGAATAPNGKMYTFGGGNGTYLTTNEEATVMFPNQSPVASITQITATPIAQGQTITFTGKGTDSDGTIIAYQWRSSISGVLGTSASFTSNSLAVGTHTIYFSVEDNNGVWSQETSAVVTVTGPDQTYQAVQNTMLLMYATLAAAIAAVMISIYGLTTRRKPTPP